MSIESPRTRDAVTVGGGAPVDSLKGTVKFHVMPEGSTDFRAAMGSFCLDAKVMREAMDTYLTNVIASRITDLKLDGYIQQQVERRIEVAIKTATAGLEREIGETATQRAREAARAAVDALRIVASIEVTTPDLTTKEARP